MPNVYDMGHRWYFLNAPENTTVLPLFFIIGYYCRSERKISFFLITTFIIAQFMVDASHFLTLY